MTFASKAELSTRVLGSERIARGRANCSIKTHTFSVPLFDGIGDAWIQYESRLRTRVSKPYGHMAIKNSRPNPTSYSQSQPWRCTCAQGGFNAINPLACTANPAACAAVRKALERDPTLTFINGAFTAPTTPLSQRSPLTPCFTTMPHRTLCAGPLAHAPASASTANAAAHVQNVQHPAPASVPTYAVAASALVQVRDTI